MALTGLTPKEFQIVLPAFERAYVRHYPPTKTRAGTVRQRKAGGGRKSVLDAPEQKLLFALVYLKAYPLQVMVGEVFELRVRKNITSRVSLSLVANAGQSCNSIADKLRAFANSKLS